MKKNIESQFWTLVAHIGIIGHLKTEEVIGKCLSFKNGETV